MLKSLWKYLNNVKPDGQFDEDYQSLYQPGLIKKESRHVHLVPTLSVEGQHKYICFKAVEIVVH